MNERLHILVVEDSEADYQLLLRALRVQGMTVYTRRVDSADTLAQAMDEESWEVVISDCRLPRFTAMDALRLCQKRLGDIPFIATSGVIDEAQAVALLKAGAHDFVTKANFARLVPALQRELREVAVRRERRKAETAWRQSENRFLTLASHSPTGIFHSDPAGRAIYFNEAWNRIAGMKNSDGLGEGWFGAIHPDDREPIRAAWFGCVGRRESFQEEFRFQWPEGAVVWVKAQAAPIQEEKGEIGGYVGTVTDVSGYKRIQEELQAAMEASEQASRAKSEFLAAMSHEIRTPMNAILGMTELLVEKVGTEDSLRMCTDVIQRNGQALVTLINDILDVTKIDLHNLVFEQGEFDLAELLDGVTGMFQPLIREKSLALYCHLEPGLPVKRLGDGGRLRQILTNLCGNAIKFTEQGRVCLAVTPNPRDGERLEFSVSDTGIGIPEEKLNTVFERFQQGDSTLSRRYGGTGLGLYIARHLVEQMGGALDVESQVGRGSCFHFELPLPVSPAAPPLEAPPSALHFGALKHQRILLAEDAEDNVLLFRMYLKESGLELHVAENGEVALNMFRERPYDIVLMDIQMPVMDGLTATRAIRAWEGQQSRPPTPVLALTAYALEGDAQRCLAAGCTGYLSKPTKKACLLKEILEQTVL